MSRYEEMFALVGQLGAQLREGYAAGAGRARAPRAPSRPRPATISALGGSAIGGSLAEALWRDSARAPTFVNRAATLPGWVGPGDLVLPVSYSGATAETLAAARSALERGADVIAVTAGEPLARPRQRRRRTGRAAFPAACLRARRSARCSGPWRQRSSTRARSRRPPRTSGRPRTPATPSPRDRGGSLASALGEALATTTTWVYGYGPLAAVARRFKSQLNENAKSTAAFGELPEADHNEIVGWAGTSRTGGRHAAIHLADPDDPPTIRASIATTPRLIDDDATLRRVLTGEGQTRTARAFWLLSLLDHASVYTARAAGVDPFEIDRIGELKQALGRRRSRLTLAGRSAASARAAPDTDRWLDCIGSTKTRGFPDDIRELRCPRHQVARPGRCGASQDRVGRSADAGAGRDSRALRAGAAAGGPADRVVPARHDRDGQSHAHAQGGRGRRRAVRIESALHAGRGRRGAWSCTTASASSPSAAWTRTATTGTSTPRSTPSRTSASTTAPTSSGSCTPPATTRWPT